MKEKIRNIILITLCLTMTVGCLTACGKKEKEPSKITAPSTNTNKTTENVENTASTETEPDIMKPDTEIIIPSGPVESVTEPSDKEQNVCLKEIQDGGTELYDDETFSVKYLGHAFEQGASDNFTMNVTNKTNSDFRFCVSTTILNGLSIITTAEQDDTNIVPAGQSKKITVKIDRGAKENVCQTEKDIKCLSFVAYVLTPEHNNPTVIKDNIVLDMTVGNHNHANDERVILGEKVYEGTDIDVYINTTPTGQSAFNRFDYTFVNKSDKDLCVYMHDIVYRSDAVTEIDMNSVCIGAKRYIAAGSYATGTMRIDNTRGENILNAQIFLECNDTTMSSTWTGNKGPATADNGQKINVRFNPDIQV